MHDLCLAIGGMTVTELRERMSYAELMSWVSYADENGPLNPMIRNDAAVARAAAPFLKSAKPRDLMPWPKERDTEATAQEAFAMIKASR